MGKAILQIILLLMAGFCVSGYSQSLNMVMDGFQDKYRAFTHSDGWGYTAPDGREYALSTARTGLSIVDVTDPVNLVEINFIPDPSNIWNDVKTYQEYAYFVSMEGGEGLKIVDLRDLPNSAPLLKIYTANNFYDSHNIWIDTTRGLLYAVGGKGWRIISLEDPENPVELVDYPSESHDFYTYENLLFVAEGWSDTLGIYDVSDPSIPIKLVSLYMGDSETYSHNVWVTDDGKTMLTTEEIDGKPTRIWNIEDLDNIYQVAEYYALGDSSNSFAHNVYARGHIAYWAHIGQGFRMADISDPANPVEIGYWHGQVAWGAYVFPTWKVLLFDTKDGLYVLRVEDKTLVTKGRHPDPHPRQPVLSLDGTGRLQLNLPSAGDFRFSVYDARGQIVIPWLSGHTESLSVIPLGHAAQTNGSQHKVLYYRVQNNAEQYTGSLSIK